MYKNDHLSKALPLFWNKITWREFHILIEISYSNLLLSSSLRRSSLRARNSRVKSSLRLSSSRLESKEPI